MGRTPKNELTSLARTSKDHLRRAEALGKSLDLRMKAKQKAADNWIPDEDWRRDFAAVTTVIQHSGKSLMSALESNKKNLGGQTTEQLEAQFREEIIAAAGSMTDEDWEAMVKAREKAR
jgi:hypothetical protein